MTTEERLKIIKNANALGYPFTTDLLHSECRFYPDEAYEDGAPDPRQENITGLSLEELHPNASGCDCCGDPADFMTCPYPEGHPDEDVTLYLCLVCANKYELTALVDQ